MSCETQRRLLRMTSASQSDGEKRTSAMTNTTQNSSAPAMPSHTQNVLGQTNNPSTPATTIQIDRFQS